MWLCSILTYLSKLTVKIKICNSAIAWPWHDLLPKPNWNMFLFLFSPPFESRNLVGSNLNGSSAWFSYLPLCVVQVILSVDCMVKQKHVVCEKPYWKVIRIHANSRNVQWKYCISAKRIAFNINFLNILVGIIMDHSWFYSFLTFVALWNKLRWWDGSHLQVS